MIRKVTAPDGLHMMAEDEHTVVGLARKCTGALHAQPTSLEAPATQLHHQNLTYPLVGLGPAEHASSIGPKASDVALASNLGATRRCLTTLRCGGMEYTTTALES